MSDVSTPREEYLNRLEDLLPPAEVARVRADVDALIEDHVGGVIESDPDLGTAEAERRAIAALGPPERLAEELGPGPMTIPLDVRRSFVRALAVLFAGHLLLSIVLTVAGAESPAIPGLLMPLPKEPFSAVLIGVITIFLIDAGAVLVLFAAIGSRRPKAAFQRLQMRNRWTRRDAWQGLVLVALLAVIFNVLLDPIFSIKEGGEWTPFLSPDLKAIVPYVNIVLALLALRHVLTLVGPGGSMLGVAADALAALTGCILLTVAALSTEIVQLPERHLGREAAEVLDSLIERVFLLMFIVGALLLLARFIRQALHLQRMLRTPSA